MKKISPIIATLICINTMIAAGLFINPRPLTLMAGPLGFMGYVLSVIVLIPLILSIAQLARLHPVSGGLYVFSKTYLGPWMGFLSGWSYFIGKTTSVAVLIHKFVLFFKPYIPILADISTLGCDFAMIFLLIGLNIIGMHVGGNVQYFFTMLKAIPILTVCSISLFYFTPAHFQITAQDIGNSFLAIPISVFALLGFEIICAIGHLIKDSDKNIKRVIITAFLTVATVDIVFQFLLFGAMGQELGILNQPVFALIHRIFPSFPLLAHLVNSFVFAAILGACFSILTSNCWNLFTLAQNGHLPGASILTSLTKTNVPWVSSMIQGVIACLILAATHDQIPLQNMAVLAQIVSFLLSTIAAVYAAKKLQGVQFSIWIPLLGIGSCLYIMTLCLTNLLGSGLSFSFIAIFAAGIALAIGKSIKSATQ